MTFDDRSACHMRTSPSIPTVFTLLHFPTHPYTFPSGRKVLEVLESLGLKTIFLYTFALFAGLLHKGSSECVGILGIFWIQGSGGMR